MKQTLVNTSRLNEFKSEVIDSALAEAKAYTDSIIIISSANPVENTELGKTLTITDSASAPIKELCIYGASSQIKTTGANKAPYKDELRPGVSFVNTNTGVTVTANTDGTYTLTGTLIDGVNSAWYYTSGNAIDYLEVGGVYKPIGGCGIYYKDQDGGHYVNTLTVTDTVEHVSLYRNIAASAYTDGMVFKPALVRSDYKGEFEPFTGGEASPSIDYPQAITPLCDSITISINDIDVDISNVELNGIDNQTDEIRYSDGKWEYIKRIKRLYLDACQWRYQGNETNKYYITIDDAASATPLCNFASVTVGWGGAVCHIAHLKRFLVDLDQLGFETLADFTSYLSATQAYIVYAAETPEVTALDIDYQPNGEAVRTITNSAGADMQVKYIADTKGYIDKKFEELRNAILSAGGNV